jgi:hypothetical protein
MRSRTACHIDVDVVVASSNTKMPLKKRSSLIMGIGRSSLLMEYSRNHTKCEISYNVNVPFMPLENARELLAL